MDFKYPLAGRQVLIIAPPVHDFCGYHITSVGHL